MARHWLFSQQDALNIVMLPVVMAGALIMVVGYLAKSSIVAPWAMMTPRVCTFAPHLRDA